MQEIPDGHHHRTYTTEMHSSCLPQKYDGMTEPETKRFSIDPDLTTYKTLRELLTKAFNLSKGNFIISYLVPRRKPWEEDKFLPMLSDWDLNTAVYGASNPQLVLKVDMKPFEEGLEEWDIIEADDFALKPVQETDNAVKRMRKSMSWLSEKKNKLSSKAAGFLSSSLDKESKEKSALGDSEWRSYLDTQGRILNSQGLRLRIYSAGVEPSLRPIVWRYLLNVYPANLSGEERMAYTRMLAEKYECLKECWERQLRSGRASDELRLLANAVRKDVVRTDRGIPFFYAAEGEENKNVLSLFNILTTYALCHPEVTYCQGMSDLASPLLVVMQDEAQAYICFCALMTRLRSNFLCDGRAMTQKFRHLSELLQYFDPVFYEYLREMHAEDLLFCYRWLLLELKREFGFNDALRVLEVMWASLPPDLPPSPQLPIYELDLTCFDESIPFSPSLSLPGTNRALRLLNLNHDKREDSPENSIDADSTPKSSPEQSGEISVENPAPDSGCDEPGSDSKVDDGNLLFPFSTNELPNGPAFSPSKPSVRKVVLVTKESKREMANNCGSPEFRQFRDRSVVSGPSTPIASSCPGNLSGLCHASLVRSLMLGKSSETKIHSCTSGSNGFSYPPRCYLDNRKSDPECHRGLHNNRNKSYGDSLGPSYNPTFSMGKREESSTLNEVRYGQNGQLFYRNDEESPPNKLSSTTRSLEKESLSQDLDEIEGKPVFEAGGSPDPEVDGIFGPMETTEPQSLDSDTRAQPDSKSDSPRSNDFRDPSTEGNSRRSTVRRSSHSSTESLIKMVSCLHPMSERRIRPSSEMTVKDTFLTLTLSSVDNKKRDKESPIPLASEACVIETVRGTELERGLTMAEIEDICVTQTTLASRPCTLHSPHSSATRSRQTSGDHTASHSKSLHPNSSQNGAGVPDSGYSGTTHSGGTTPYTYSVELMDTSMSERITGTCYGVPIQEKKSLSVGGASSNKPLEFVHVEKDGNFLLPPPAEFGDGNPFLMFICLTLLLEHRDRIIKQQMDFNEIAIYFDKLARKHSAQHILQRARILYTSYLRSGWFREPEQ